MTMPDNRETRPEEIMDRTLPSLFRYRPAPEGRVKIVTPFLYPDRDVIQVYAEREAGGWTVTDFGEAWDALELGCIASGVGPEARKRAGSVCADLVEREGYQLVLRGVSDEGLAQAVMRLAQAILLVANSGDLGG